MKAVTLQNVNKNQIEYRRASLITVELLYELVEYLIISLSIITIFI
jgi:hypothetical protein